MWWPSSILTLALELGILCLAVRRLFRGPKYSIGEGLQLLGHVPATPSLMALAYLFPGRGTPPDPKVPEATAAFVDRRPDPPIPSGLRRIESFH